MTSRIVLVSLLAVLVACAGKVVTRVEPDTDIDLSGRWNDADSRRVAETIVADCLTKPWIDEHLTQKAEKPVVIVGNMRNKSSEHVAMGTFVGDIEREFVNSGRVEVVASRAEREEVREEREDQSYFADEETVKEMGRELGADYMMQGDLNSILDQEEGKQVRYYQVDMTLIDIQTNRKVWLGQTKIKKYVGRSKYKP
jgi:uncharacterized protein (TIGR02722 family)